MSEYENWRDYFPEFKGKENGTILKANRQRKGVTQVELARRTGISRTNISAMENGKKSIGEEMAKTLANALELENYRVLRAFL